ncbi:MAG TPA: flagellar protein FlaG [Methylotenera sp.]|nr:flagellar protein FlaG [Methylotenera sp.]
MDINNLNSLVPAGKSASGDFALRPDKLTTNDGTDIAVNQQQLPVSSPAVAEQADSQRQQVDQAVSQINDYVQNVQRSLQFSIDEMSGRNVVKVIDKTTEEVIRQIPIEEVLVIARTIAEQLDEGVSLFSSQA